jgi:hypothetical protein
MGDFVVKRSSCSDPVSRPGARNPERRFRSPIMATTEAFDRGRFATLTTVRRTRSTRSTITWQRHALIADGDARSGRRVEAAINVSAVALVHELIELGAIPGNAETLQEFLELALLVFEPAQCLSAIVIESTIAD